MEAKVVSEQLTSLGCVVRRCLAKITDVALFTLLSFPLALLAVQQPLRFDGLIPAVLSSLWIVGFIIGADLVCSLAFGVTPGELLAGIRVTTLDERRLAVSERQDRTTDSLVEGTVGCLSLLPLFWRRQPAPYDKGCAIHFSRMTPQRLLATSIVVAAICLGVGVAGVALGIKDFESSAPTAVTRLMRQLGFEVNERWRNPITGRSVALPKGWSVVTTETSPSFGDVRFDIECGKPGAACLISLGLQPGFDMGELFPDLFTTEEALRKSLERMVVTEVVPGSMDPRSNVYDAQRLDILYTANLVVPSGADKIQGSGFVWFSDRRHMWALGVVRPAEGGELAEEAVELAFSLIQSSLDK